MRPPKSRSPPNASAYAVITHCLLPSEMPRSVWAEGRAMFTMVASSTTISWARAMNANAFQRLGSGRVPAVFDMELAT